MTAMTISWIVFGVVFGGAVLGMILRALLPEHHMREDSRDVVKLAMGLIGTMTALVLGLLIASAKGSYDTQRNGLAQMSGNVSFLDQILERYGPESKEARDMLRASVADTLQQTWPEENPQPGQPKAKAEDTTGRYKGFYTKLEALAPKNDAQRSLQSQALKTAADIGQARWVLRAEGRLDPHPVPGGDGFLARAHSRQLRPVRAPQCDGLCYFAVVLAGGCERDFPDPGAGSAVRRNHSDFQRPAAQRPDAAGPVVLLDEPHRPGASRTWQCLEEAS